MEYVLTPIGARIDPRGLRFVPSWGKHWTGVRCETDAEHLWELQKGIGGLLGCARCGATAFLTHGEVGRA